LTICKYRPTKVTLKVGIFKSFIFFNVEIMFSNITKNAYICSDMKTIFAYILLFCYTLTCIGATLKMHRCHGNTMLALQESAGETMRESCPICQKHEAQTPHACNAGAESENCCKDVLIDLKKSQEDAESAQASAKLPVLSPTILTLVWISVFRPGLESAAHPLAPDQLAARPPSKPAYLVHCNFRI